MIDYPGLPQHPQQADNTPLWNVTAVENDTVFDRQHVPEEVVRVRFTIHDGSEHEVIIPAKDFKPDEVRSLVHDQAMKLNAVLQLQGPPAHSPHQLPAQGFNPDVELG